MPSPVYGYREVRLRLEKECHSMAGRIGARDV